MKWLLIDVLFVIVAFRVAGLLGADLGRLLGWLVVFARATRESIRRRRGRSGVVRWRE